MDNNEDTNKMVGGIDNPGYGYSEQPSTYSGQPPTYSGQPPNPTQQPYPSATTYPGSQPNAGQPYAGHPYAGQPYAGQPYPAQPYPAGPYSGQQSHNTTTAVIVNQQPTQSTVVVRAPPDNMTLAIFACLCCFWPLGLVAIYKANESQNALARGDFNEAARNGNEARMFSLISVGIGVAGIIIAIIIGIAVPMSYSYNSGSSYSNNYG